MTTNYQTDQSKRLIWLAIILLIVVATVLKVVAAAPVWMHHDEVYYLNIGQNYIMRGGLTPYMWRLDVDTNVIAGSGTGYGILLLVGWMKLIGNTLLGGRLLMIGLGLITTGVMYLVARKWWESEVAGVTTLIFALVGTSPFYSFVIRMDSPGMLCYSLILLLHVHAVRRQARWLHFATGIAVVAFAEFHVLSIMYAIVLGIWYITDYIRQVMSKRQLVLDAGLIYYAGAGIIATAIYIAIHILPDPAAYFSIPSQFFGPSLTNETLRYARFLVLRPVEFVLLFVVSISALLRRGPEDRHFLILMGAWLVVMPSIPPYVHYTNHMWPILAIGLGGLMARGLKYTGKLNLNLLRFGALLAVATLVLNIGLHITGSQPTELREQLSDHPVLAFIRETVPEDTVVLAHSSHFYYLSNFINFMSYGNAEERAVMQRGETMLDYWRREQPEVIIGNDRSHDPLLDQYMTEKNFQEVQSQLWIADRLLQELSIETVSNAGAAS